MSDNKPDQEMQGEEPKVETQETDSEQADNQPSQEDVSPDPEKNPPSEKAANEDDTAPQNENSKDKALKDIGKRLTSEQAKTYMDAPDEKRIRAVKKLAAAVNPVPFYQKDAIKLPAVFLVGAALSWLAFAPSQQTSTPDTPNQQQTILSTPLHGATTALLRPHPGNQHQVFTAPLEFFHRKSGMEIKALFQDLTTKAGVLPIHGSNFTAIDADNRWAIKGQGLYPDVKVLVDVEDANLRSSMAIEKIVGAMDDIENDARANTGLDITYRFEVVTNVPVNTPKYLRVMRDIGSDKTAAAGPDDMQQIYKVNLP